MYLFQIDQWRMSKIDFQTRKAQEIELNSKLDMANKHVTKLESKIQRVELPFGENTLLTNKIQKYESEASNITTKLASYSERIAELENKAKSSTLTDNTKNEIVNEYNNIKSKQSIELDNLNKNLVQVDSEVETFLKPSARSTNIFSFVGNLKESYVDFIHQLSLEELAIITNLMGLFMILFSLLSITTIMFGEYLVNYFQLEHKFPKLSKYIQLRSKLSKTALIIYFIYIYLVVIIFIIINIYMFFY